MEKEKQKIDEKYLKSEVSKINDGDLEMVMKNNKQISQKITDAGALKKYTELAKGMFGMIGDYRKGNYKKVPWFTIAAAGFSLLYIFNPLDIVPDFIPGFGYVDDLGVFALSLKFIQSDLHKYLEWKTEESSSHKMEQQATPATANTGETGTADTGTHP